MTTGFPDQRGIGTPQNKINYTTPKTKPLDRIFLFYNSGSRSAQHKRSKQNKGNKIARGLIIELNQEHNIERANSLPLIDGEREREGEARV